MHTIETKKYTLHLLLEVKRELDEHGQKYALCSAMSAADDCCEDRLGSDLCSVEEYKEDLFRQWPEFSGRTTYPVTVSFEELSGEYTAVISDKYEDDCGEDEDLDWGDEGAVACALFNAVANRDLYGGNFWDASTLYGAARRRLLDWMIEKVKEEIADEG